VRVERVTLKHHRQVALLRRRAGHFIAANQDAPGCGQFESSNEPQQRALSAARRADQHQKFAVGDLQIDSACGHVAVRIGFRDAFE
jgi:hypothetical protein